MPLLVAFGGWIPLFLNQDSSRNIVVHELPEFISIIQRIAMFGIFVSVFLAFKMLPPRPARYKRHRSVMMVLQWLLMPITSVVFGSLAAYNAQTHLAIGKYLDRFDVTDKSVKK
jgi:ABC-type dipeptide/oligopeptide/nickel transport system permease component